jgi:hypothetical protein
MTWNSHAGLELGCMISVHDCIWPQSMNTVGLLACWRDTLSQVCPENGMTYGLFSYIHREQGRLTLASNRVLTAID